MTWCHNPWRRGDSGRLSALLHFRTHVTVCIARATLAVIVIQDDMFSVRGGPCFKYHKANRTITKLILGVNVIGHEGAGLLAEALKATLATLLASRAHTLIFWSCRNSFARFSPKLVHNLLIFGTAVFQSCCGRCSLLGCAVPSHRSSRPHVVSVDSVW